MVRIEALSKQNKKDFFSLFSEDQFAHQRDWKSCFCRFYLTDCNFEEWLKRNGSDNRIEAEKEIDAGNMNGLLAFKDDLCIGWLNVGPVPVFKRLIDDIEAEYINEKTALSICFVIRESHRAKGIASLLLDEAIERYRRAGYVRMIALPRDSNTREKNYRGFSQMYVNRRYKERISSDGSRYFVLDL